MLFDEEIHYRSEDKKPKEISDNIQFRRFCNNEKNISWHRMNQTIFFATYMNAETMTRDLYEPDSLSRPES